MSSRSNAVEGRGGGTELARADPAPCEDGGGRCSATSTAELHSELAQFRSQLSQFRSQLTQLPKKKT